MHGIGKASADAALQQPSSLWLHSWSICRMEKVISDLVQRIPEEPLQITLFTITQQVTCRETLYVLVEKVGLYNMLQHLGPGT